MLSTATKYKMEFIQVNLFSFLGLKSSYSDISNNKIIFILMKNCFEKLIFIPITQFLHLFFISINEENHFY